MKLTVPTSSNYSLPKMGWGKRQKEGAGIGPEERNVGRRKGVLLLSSLTFGLLLGSLQPAAADILYSVTYLNIEGVALNNFGQVTGSAYAYPGNRHAFLYTDGRMQDLGTLGGVVSNGVGLNNLGQVTGSASTSAGNRYAFFYTDGRMQDLGTLPGYLESQGFGLNNFGQVTGSAYAYPDFFNPRAFLYTDGRMQDLGTLGGNTSIGYSINDRGQVVGSASTSNSPAHAFLYTDGRMQDLGTLGGGFSNGVGINDRGQVVGTSGTPAGSDHAFLYTDGHMQDLGTLGGSFSDGYGLNNLGQVVGYAQTSLFMSHAFLYSNGRMQDLNDLIDPALHITLSSATAINDRGQIVAGSVAGSYLLTPVPEPSTWALFGVALLGCGFWVRARRI